MFYVKQNNIVLTLVIGNDNLFFVFGQKEYQKPYMPIYYETFVSSTYQLYDGIIYNHSCIRNMISCAIKTHKIYPAFIMIIVDNKQLSQNFVIASQPIKYVSDVIERFNYTVCSEHMHYIGPCHETDHLLCKCAITDYALLQYQLLLLPFRIPILNITCSIHALLYAYRGYKGKAFRLSELVNDIIKNDNNIINFFTQDMFYRLLPNLFISDIGTKKAFLLTYGHMVYQELLYG